MFLKTDMTDRYGNVIFEGEQYLKSIRSKDIRFKKYELMILNPCTLFVGEK